MLCRRVRSAMIHNIFGFFHGPVNFRWPWMALVGYRNSIGEVSFKCGGSIISNRHVLTGLLTFDRNMHKKANWSFRLYFSGPLHPQRFVSWLLLLFNVRFLPNVFHQVISSIGRTRLVNRHGDQPCWHWRGANHSISKLRQEGRSQRLGNFSSR